MAEENKEISKNIDEDLEKVLEFMKSRLDVVPDYIKLLQHGDLLERTKSADALGEIGDVSAVPALIEALDDESAEIR